MLLILAVVLYLAHKLEGSCKALIHPLVVPFLLLVVIKKHFEKESEKFHLSECFCTFLLIMVFSSLNSPLHYYLVQLINILSVTTFYIAMIIRYGISEIGLDFYHNMGISLTLIAFIHQ
jgi:4-amino-4-deoxy-L-arabinose transferase-like glycosyltransferase